MFVQIITAKVTDPDLHRRQLDTWRRDLKPGAKGYLGSTGGVTADGELFQIVRFASEAAAEENSTRAEQGLWWSATEAALDNVAFVNSSDVRSFVGGGSDAAGFVQVMEAAVSDRARFDELLTEFETKIPAHRPELFGGLVIWHDDGRMTMAAYFASEAEARAGEAREMPDDMKALDDEWRSLLSDLRFYDLVNPELDSA